MNTLSGVIEDYKCDHFLVDKVFKVQKAVDPTSDVVKLVCKKIDHGYNCPTDWVHVVGIQVVIVALFAVSCLNVFAMDQR